MQRFKESFIPAWSSDSERIIATPSHFARNTLFYVQEIGHFHTHSPYFTERERLDSFLLVYTVSGSGKLTYKHETYTLQSQQIFLIDCMEAHCYWTPPESNWELLWVHFNGRSVRGYYDLFMAQNSPVTTALPAPNVPRIIKQMIELNKQKSLANELLCSKLLVEMLTSCLLDRDRPPFGTTEEVPAYIHDMLQMITRHYRQPFTLDGLARQFAVSKFHMVKQFKRYTGFTPGEYIINTRLTKAKELLQYSNRAVADIAEEVGIDNVSHFINLFKHREGCTPLAFRKQWQQPKW